MDRTHLLGAMFNDFVFEHEFIQANPKLRREALAVAVALGELYQSVGTAAFAVHDAADKAKQSAKQSPKPAKSPGRDSKKRAR